ncbi:single-stranded DNA-binding protein, partial [Streptomyces lunaelactis]
MAGEVTPTIYGRVYEDPQLRHADSGRPIARFRVVSFPREYDRTSGEWRDGEPVLVVCTAWGRLAKHVAASLADRVHVIVTGQLTACDAQLHLNVTRVGVDLDAHIAYIDATLPAVLAGKGPRNVRAALKRPNPDEPAADPARKPAATPPVPYWMDEERRRQWADITAPQRPRPWC